MPAVTRALCEVFTCRECEQHNAALCERILALQDSELAHKSHYFNGRFENIYIASRHLPGIEMILDTAREHAAQLLQLQTPSLQLGFWINLMQAGDVTLAHTHDDDDELLSGTYYLQVPPGAGELILTLPTGKRTITPRPGQFVLFHPTVEHEVTAHQGTLPRISIGFNIGLRQRD